MERSMIWQDSRIAVRFLGRTPGFTIAAALTIAVAVAMSTAVFSLVNAMFLRPLPYKDAGRLAIIWSTDAEKGRGPVSFDDFADWTRSSKTISSGAVYSSYYHPTLTGSGAAERLSAILISHDYFKVMGVEPVLGRFLTPEEDRDGPDNVVVLSQDMWRNRFQSDPQVIGRSILLNAQPHVIVGVAGADLFPLPPGLAGAPPQLYRPVGEPFSPGSRDGRHLQTLVRLRPGATVEQAQAELDVRCRQMERENAADARLSARIVTLRQDLTRNVGSAILALQGAVLLLLLLACANVANLLLVRSTARQQEFAVRAALGASRGRLARMLLVESLMLGLLGGLGGSVLAAWATTALSAFTARILPNVGVLSVDFRVLVFSLLLSIAASLLFGLAPLFHLQGESFSGRRIVGGRGNRSRQALVAVQIAAAVVLLTATGLIGQSFLRLRDINPGFDPDNVLTAQLALPSARYPIPTL